MRRLLRGWLSGLAFYAVAAAGAAALILASLSGPRKPPPEPLAGVAANGAVTFDAAALSRIDPGRLDWRLVRAPRTLTVTGVKLAAPTGEPPAEAAASARLLLAPQLQADWAGRPLEIEVDAAPLVATTAAELAVGVERADSPDVQWLRLPLGSEAGAVRFAAPAGPAPRALVIRPVETARADYSYGVELRAVRVRPLERPPG